MKLAGMSSNGNALPRYQSPNFDIPISEVHPDARFLCDRVNRMPVPTYALSKWMREEFVVLWLLSQERMIQCPSWSYPARRFGLHELFEKVKGALEVRSV
jgi:hypothetical protein